MFLVPAGTTLILEVEDNNKKKQKQKKHTE